MKISKEEKEMWLEDWKRSGKKAWTYAKENDLLPQTFCGWVKRAERISQDGFVEVSKQIKPQTASMAEIRVEKGGINIYIPLFVWTENSAAVLEGLKGAL